MLWSKRFFAYSAAGCLLFSTAARAEVDLNRLLASLSEAEETNTALAASAEQATPEEDALLSSIEPDNAAPPPSDASPPLSDELPGAGEGMIAEEELLDPVEPTPPLAVPAQPYTLQPSSPASDVLPSTTTLPQHAAAASQDATAEARIAFGRMFHHPAPHAADVALQHPACGSAGPRHTCQAHRRPSLPQPATLESMYHCKPCYRDVWAGYAVERQHKCDKYHKHLHGRCDCFEPEPRYAGPPLYAGPLCQPEPCDGQSGLLHRLFHRQSSHACDCESAAECHCGD